MVIVNMFNQPIRSQFADIVGNGAVGRFDQMACQGGDDNQVLRTISSGSQLRQEMFGNPSGSQKVGRDDAIEIWVVYTNRQRAVFFILGNDPSIGDHGIHAVEMRLDRICQYLYLRVGSSIANLGLDVHVWIQLFKLLRQLIQVCLCSR